MQFDHQVPTLADVGEFELIDRISSGLPTPASTSVGPGDDGAVFLVNGSAVVSVDQFVEGVDFRRDWSDATDVGHRCVGSALADIEAMGARALSVAIAFSAPPDLPEAWLVQFVAGVRAELDTAEAGLIGGDLSRANQIQITVTAIGQTDDVAPVQRSGARPDQVVAMCGRLGWAAAGLAALGRGFRSPKAAVDAYRRPLVPYGAGREAAQAGARSMIDVSDGLLADLGHIARASEVAIDLDSARFSVAEPVQAVAAATGRNALDLVFTGGEDHALVATFDMGDVPNAWTVIGRVLARPEDGLPAVRVDGRTWITEGHDGWTHF